MSHRSACIRFRESGTIATNNLRISGSAHAKGRLLVFYGLSCLILAACANPQSAEPVLEMSLALTEESLIYSLSTAQASNVEATTTAETLGSNEIRNSDPIRVLSITEENNYPDGMTFQLIAEADSSITQINLYFRDRSEDTYTTEAVEFTPGTKVITSYTWDTSRLTVAPSTILQYYWEIEDDVGQLLTTVEQDVSYDDLRFAWQELADPDLIVRWYEGDQIFGFRVFQVAQQALTQMKAETGQDLDIPILMLLYANDEDYASWHYFVEEWVGGEAFSSLGITTQIISPNAGPDWIGDVVPHEIAHVFLFQTISSTPTTWPSWLSEGFAQYYEFGDKRAALSRSYRAARDGRLVPLAHLWGDFGNDLVEVDLAYDLSLSALLYMIENWGNEGLQKLIELVQKEKLFRTAMEGALDVSVEEFEAGWRTWLGAPTTPIPTVTARPTIEKILPPGVELTTTPSSIP